MNFQNIPRGNKLIKKAFLPKLDCLVYFDYSQIEYRLLAYYLAAQLGDYTMADNFKAGIDPHAATARVMLGYPADRELTDAERQVGKTGNFSIIYAGGVPTIMRQLKCDERRAAQLLKALKAGMPGIKALNNEIYSIYDDRGYIKTIAGRHLTVDPAIVKKRGENRARSALLNYLIQGGAAELMRDALRKTHYMLADQGFKAHMVSVVHDEIQIDAPEGELERLQLLVPPCMGNEEVESYVPIGVDMEVSRQSWADKTKYEL